MSAFWSPLSGCLSQTSAEQSLRNFAEFPLAESTQQKSVRFVPCCTCIKDGRSALRFFTSSDLLRCEPVTDISDMVVKFGIAFIALSALANAALIKVS